MSKRATIIITDNIVKKTYVPQWKSCWEKEVAFYQSFKHNNVMVPIEVNEKELSIIMPNAGKKISQAWKFLTDRQKDAIIDQFVDALFSLHKNCWLLRDLHAENSLVSGDQLTLIDFEHAIQVPLLPFKDNCDLVKGKKSSWTFWDCKIRWGLSGLTGITSKDIVEKMRQKLIERSLLVSGPGLKIGDGQLNYQAIDVPNLLLPGLRSTKERLLKLGITNLGGKSVLDIGCNIGGFGIHCDHLGARKYFGIETQSCRVDFANDLIAFVGVANNSIVCGNIQQLIPNDKYDVVFALAIDRYTNARWLYKKLFEVTNEVCYIESNRHKNIEKTKQEIEQVGFKAQFLFCSDDTCGRVNFVCRKV